MEQYYTELIKAHMERFDKTRQIQWTFNGLFWTGIMISATVLKGKDVPIDKLFYFYSLAIIVSYFVIMFMIQRSLDFDKEMFKSHRIRLGEKIGFSEPKIQDFKFLWLIKIKRWFWIWIFAQTFVTVLLLFGTIVFLGGLSCI